MHWQQIVDSPLFRDLPFRIETDATGKIVMSPASNRHSIHQGLLVQMLSRACPEGVAFPECSIQTADGVKVADVVWIRDALLAPHENATPLPVAPEIVIEIASPANPVAELLRKKELYFARGAQEVWLCDETGALRFFNNHAELPASARVPEFPASVARKPAH